MYTIGEIIDDMKIINKDNSRNKAYIVECTKCQRQKSILSQNLKRHVGTTHKACSQNYRKKYPQLYTTWNAMVERCTNPNNKRFSDYGKRGIVHEFPLFIDFVDYMLDSYIEHCEKYGKENTTLDRIDNNKGYIKGNIRWATTKEQAENKRTTITFIAISPNNQKYICKNAEEFAKRFNLDRSTISKVLHKKRKTCKGWHFYKTSRTCVETIERIPNQEIDLGIIE